MAAVLLEGASKAFGGSPVLDGLHLAVPNGAVYGFLGRNGAGKTTTLRALLGLHALDGGTLTLFGEVVPRPGIREKRRIGYVGQEQHLYGWMTAVQLGRFVGGLYPTWDTERFHTLLHRFSVPDRQRSDTLSGGTRVKLALCLALAPHPDLLVLDEPTAGLDPVARRELLDLVREQAETEGRTTIFSGHVVAEIERVADVIGVLDGGRLQYEGTIDVLLGSLRGFEGEVAIDGATVLARREERGAVFTVLQGAPELWEGRGQPLSLEDAFLALSLYRVRP